jgi:peptidylamidoglycolate lyase
MMFNRRKFIQTAAMTASALAVTDQLGAQTKGANETIGHGDFKYRVDKKWSKANPKTHPVNNCHEMVQVPDGRLFLLTDQAKNNIIIFDKDGQVKGSWTLNMRGAHGLTLSVEKDVPYLYLTDTSGRVAKTDLEGKVLLEVKDAKNRATNPTETAIGPNGDIYVIDGYGTNYVYQYSSTSKFIRKFGGKSTQPVNKGKFMQAHGIALDSRSGTPLLVCTARLRNEFHWFTLDGKWKKTVYLPGVYMSRPVISGDYLYSGVCFGTFPNDFRGWQDRGFIVILDKNDRVVSAPGAIQPKHDAKGQLQHLYQEVPVFENCHDVCVDNDGNLYGCQWSANRVYPYKLTKI